MKPQPRAGPGDLVALSPRAARSSLAKLIPYAVGVWPLLASALVCILASSLLELAVPWVMGFLLLDTVVKEARLDALPRVVFLLVAIFLGQKGVGFLQDYFQELANQRLVHRLRCDLFHHLQCLPDGTGRDRKSTRLNSSHITISYAVFCLKKKTPKPQSHPPR